MWTIRAYCQPKGRKTFVEEYAAQSVATKAECRAVLNELRAQPNISGWCRPNGFDRLNKNYRALGKLRFKVLNVQHRPLGFFGPGPKTFTLLTWATERDGDYDPPGIRDVALRRMNEVLADAERSHEFK